METGRGEMHSAGAMSGFDSFSGHGGERGGGGAPAVAQNGHGLGTTAGSAGVQLGHGKNDDILATQKYQGVAGASGRVARGEAHGDGTGGSCLGRKTASRGLRDQAMEVFVRRLLQLSKLRLNGQDKRDGGDSVGEG